MYPNGFVLHFSRLCRSNVKLEGIQSIIFRGPSHVGERVSLKSSVNKAFSNNRFVYLVEIMRSFTHITEDIFNACDYVLHRIL